MLVEHSWLISLYIYIYIYISNIVVDIAIIYFCVVIIKWCASLCYN